MKKITFLSLIFIFSSSIFIYAQPDKMEMVSKEKKQQMMQQNWMHQQMMHNHRNQMMQGSNCPMCGRLMHGDMPMVKHSMLVNMLPNLSDSLSLTEKQTEQLIDMRAEFKKDQVDYMASLSKKRMKLKDMMEQNADAEEVKEQMIECSEIKAIMNAAAYETSQRMKSVLDSQQMSKLKDMEPRNFKRMMGHDAIMQTMMNEMIMGGE